MGILRRRRMIARWFFALASVLAVLAFVRLDAPSAHAESQPLYVVAGLSFPGTDLSFTSLKSSFRGEGVDVQGKHVIPVNHALGSPLRVQFDRSVLGLEPSAVGRFWVDQRIRDEGKPPTTASSPDLAIRIAAALAGAITYVPKDMLNPKLKVLTIDGKSPGQGGYALQK
jgi:hypothetical protein